MMMAVVRIMVEVVMMAGVMVILLFEQQDNILIYLNLILICHFKVIQTITSLKFRHHPSNDCNIPTLS